MSIGEFIPSISVVKSRKNNLHYTITK